ncbi:MAG: ribosome biogenesis GTP-binding protein YihA/YsxC [Gammaproteobacteria bacterium]|nr:ribosome biogenesis GTP-binding protein YihA/YsxC [Gammaproteobacteria bacterium]
MNPVYRRAKFLLAVQHIKQLPDDILCEVGFAGRSNAGKSSSINTITGIHSLARTSKTPGRTQQIVYFTLDDEKALVDLPGYGFAKVPPSVKKHWHELMEGYFTNRKPLKGLVLVMDIRHPMREFDEQMLGWCQHAKTPAHILLTKADKLSNGAAKSELLKVRKMLKEMEFDNVTVQTFSSLKRTGSETVMEKMDEWLGYSTDLKSKSE